MFKKIIASLIPFALILSMAVIPASAAPVQSEQQREAEIYSIYLYEFLSLAEYINNTMENEQSSILSNLSLSFAFACVYGVSQDTLDVYKKQADDAIEAFAVTKETTEAFREYLMYELEKSNDYSDPGYEESFFTPASVAAYHAAQAAFVESLTGTAEVFAKAGKAILFAYASLEPVENFNNLALATVLENFSTYYPPLYYTDESNEAFEAFRKKAESLLSSNEIIPDEEIVALFTEFEKAPLEYSSLGLAVDILENNEMIMHPENYTRESFLEFEQAFNDLHSAADQNSDDLEACIDKFYETSATLELTPRFCLEEMLSVLFDNDEMLYSKESFDEYTAEMMAAKELLENPSASDEALEVACNALDLAMTGLEPVPMFDYISSYLFYKHMYESLELPTFTEASITGIEDALSGFEALLESGIPDKDAFEEAAWLIYSAFNNVELVPAATAKQAIVSVKAEYIQYFPDDFYAENLSKLISALYELENALVGSKTDSEIATLIGKLYIAYTNNRTVPLVYAKTIIERVSSVLEEDSSAFTKDSYNSFIQAYDATVDEIAKAEGLGKTALYDLADNLYIAFQSLEYSVRAQLKNDFEVIENEINSYQGLYSEEFMLDVRSEVSKMSEALENESLTDDELYVIYDDLTAYLNRYVYEHYEGDIDGDSEITISDAVLAFQNVAGKTDLRGAETLAADLDEDGKITIVDAILLFKTVAGKA